MPRWHLYAALQTNDAVVETTFYITETSAFRNQVLYFRHDDWETLCAPLVERLTSGTFEKMPQVVMPIPPFKNL